MHDTPFAEARVSEFLDHLIHASQLDLHFDLHSPPSHPSTLTVTFTGPDLNMLTEDDSSLLDAIAHMLVEICGFAAASTSSASITIAEAQQAHAGVF